MRIAILQRVCPDYRVALFAALSATDRLEMRLFIGEDLPIGKVRSAGNLGGVSITRLKTRFLKCGRRTLPWHVGLITELKEFRPDVILCEGESHFLGYLQAIYYRARYAREVALIHWCFIALPGESSKRHDIAGVVKGYFRRHFDAFLVYSSYSKERLIELGVPVSKVFVATNVGDVSRFVMLSDALKASKSDARRQLSLPERFTVLYVGTLDENKRPGVMLDLAHILGSELYSFVLVGSGALLESLRRRAESENTSNVHLPGRVSDKLSLYYRAADVLLIPGRGGIVMSEAMAGGVPVVVHQADGTEYDLVDHRITGYRVPSGRVHDFAVALQYLQNNPTLVANMASNCQEVIRRRFHINNMVEQIVRASTFARNARLNAVS